MKYDIITFGSASEDIFVFSKEFFDKKLCFSLGDKVEMDKILIRTGGGGTNVATTFAKQGLKTAYCGSVGKDYAGFSMLLDLKRSGISTEFLSSLKGRTTNHSVILSKKEKGKVILVYRDASGYLPKDFSLKELKAKWFYLAPLSGEFAKKTKDILDHAKLYGIKIALNPSKEQIKLFKKDIKGILSKTDVFIVNEKERKFLFGDISIEKIFKEISPYSKGILASGDKKGAYFLNDKNIYRTDFSKTKITDLTGAGDAFGSGLTAGLIKGLDMIQAIQLSNANIKRLKLKKYYEIA